MSNYCESCPRRCAIAGDVEGVQMYRKLSQTHVNRINRKLAVVLGVELYPFDVAVPYDAKGGVAWPVRIPVDYSPEDALQVVKDLLDDCPGPTMGKGGLLKRRRVALGCGALEKTVMTEFGVNGVYDAAKSSASAGSITMY